MLTKPVLLFAVGLFSFTVDGSVIYDNGQPNQVDGSNISAYISADDFTIAANARLSSIIFWSSADVDPYQSQFSGTIGWGIFANSSGMPGTLLFAGADSAPILTDTGLQIYGTEEWALSITLPSISLSQGTYWLALHEGTLGTPDDGTELYWDTTSRETGSVGMVNGDSTGQTPGWFANGLISASGADLAFQLTGDLTPDPEPSSLPLLSAIITFAVLSNKGLLPKTRIFSLESRYSLDFPVQR